MEFSEHPDSKLSKLSKLPKHNHSKLSNLSKSSKLSIHPENPVTKLSKNCHNCQNCPYTQNATPRNWQLCQNWTNIMDMQIQNCQNCPNTQKTTLKQPILFKELTFLKKVLEQHLFSAEKLAFSVSGLQVRVSLDSSRFRPRLRFNFFCWVLK